MSNLHKMKIKHQGMNPEEKMECNCELCKGLNVDKTKRKSNVPESNIEDLVKKMDDIKSEPLVTPDQKVVT